MNPIIDNIQPRSASLFLQNNTLKDQHTDYLSQPLVSCKIYPVNKKYKKKILMSHLNKELNSNIIIKNNNIESFNGIMLPKHLKQLYDISLALDQTINLFNSRRKPTTFESIRECVQSITKVYYSTLMSIGSLI